MDLRILQRAPTATAITTPSMLAKLTIHNASLLARAAPIRMGVFKLQAPTNLNLNQVCDGGGGDIFLNDNHEVWWFTHKQSTIHTRAMTTPSMLAELTMRNASLLDRAAPIGTRIFELQPTSNRCVVVFFHVIIMVCGGSFTSKSSYTSEP